MISVIRKQLLPYTPMNWLQKPPPKESFRTILSNVSIAEIDENEYTYTSMYIRTILLLYLFWQIYEKKTESAVYKILEAQ